MNMEMNMKKENTSCKRDDPSEEETFPAAHPLALAEIASRTSWPPMSRVPGGLVLTGMIA